METHDIVFSRGYLKPLTNNICAAVCMTYVYV